MGAKAEHQERGILTPRYAEPKRQTFLARITGWFTGASRQDFAGTEDQTKTAVHEVRSEANTAEKSTQTVRPTATQKATGVARGEEVSSDAIDCHKPLIKIATEAGKVHFMRLEDWQRAKENGARDVPLCEWNGEPISNDGRKKTLRLSTLSKCELIPMELPTMDGLLHHEQDSEPGLGL